MATTGDCNSYKIVLGNYEADPVSSTCGVAAAGFGQYGVNPVVSRKRRYDDDYCTLFKMNGDRDQMIFLKSIANIADRYKFSTKQELKMVAQSFYLPKNNVLKPLGEDAHFIREDEQVIGVADGVGGWAAKGVDAGEYARELMSNCVQSVRTQKPLIGFVDPLSVLHEAFSNAKSRGSSTACIISFQGQTLRVANVGDSGFMVIRNGAAVYKSPVQQHSFSCPYQVGNTGKINDHPRNAQELQLALQSGDTIVVGTDGLFDNMDESQIEETVNQGRGKGKKLKEIASEIANLALYNSFDRFADSPYARAARKAGRRHRGGKVDDITVLVASILPSSF